MILTLSSYRRAFSKLSEEQREIVENAVDRLEGSFGVPHLHSGVGIRRFGKYFEARAGLGLRIPLPLREAILFSRSWAITTAYGFREGNELKLVGSLSPGLGPNQALS